MTKPGNTPVNCHFDLAPLAIARLRKSIRKSIDPVRWREIEEAEGQGPRLPPGTDDTKWTL